MRRAGPESLRRQGRGRAARAALIAALGCVVALPAMDGRTQTGSTNPQAEVRITSFTPWIDAALPFHFDITVSNTGSVPIESPRIFLTIYDRVRSRSGLRAGLDGNPQQGDLTRIPEEIDRDLPPGDSVKVRFERHLGEITNALGKRGTGGVYPAEIQVRGSTGKLWSGWSAIVFLPEAPLTQLNVTWVLPVHYQSMFEPSEKRSPLSHGAPLGVYPARDVDAALAPGGKLLALARAVAKVSSLPVTLAPTPLVLDEMADVAGGYTRVESSRTLEAASTDAVPRAAGEVLKLLHDAAASSNVEIATVPYSRADVISLIHSNLQADAAEQLSVGASQTSTHLGRTPNAAVLVPADLRLDSRAAAAVAGLGVQSVVLDPDLLPPQTGLFGPDEPVTVAGRGGVRLNALLADPPIRERLERAGADPVLLAQGVLAETASSWYERPAFAGARALVVATSTSPPPATIAALAEGLAAAPWIAARSASQLLAAVPPKEQDPQPLKLGSAAPSDQIQAARTARRAVEVLSRVVLEPAKAADPLRRLVLAAESADWAESSRGVSLAHGAKAIADGIVGGIHTAERRVTLTSRTGNLPVTVFNDTPFRIGVQIRLSSAKVSFPNGARRDVAVSEHDRTTITVPAKARAAGAFGVDVEMRTPDGDFPIGRGELVVRSTAVSAVALIAIGGGLLVLIVAWFRRGHRRRRDGSPAIQPEHPEDAGSPQPA